MTETRKWSALAVVLVAAIFALSWFLMISPKRGEAAELRDKVVSQSDANARLEQQLQVLMAQQQDLPKQRARLADLRTRIPGNPALPSLIRDLTASGRKVGVSIDSMAPSAPVAVVAPLAPAPVPAAGTGTGEATTDSAPAPAVPAAPAAAASTLYQVPLSLTVTGSYFELEQFLNKLEGLKRSMLITGFTLGEASSEAAADDDLSINLTGRVFLSQETTTPTPTMPVAPASTTQGQ